VGFLGRLGFVDMRQSIAQQAKCQHVWAKIFAYWDKMVHGHDLRLTTVARLATIPSMKKSRKNQPPPSVKREMHACRLFVAKLDSVLPKAAQTATFAELGIPRNQIKRWRDGRTVRLDYAWLLAKKLAVSLEWLADDERPERPSKDEMDEVMRAVERLGFEVAMDRLMAKPEVAQPETVQKPPPPDPPKSRQRQPRSQNGAG
jgi:hypothetical protein